MPSVWHRRLLLLTNASAIQVRRQSIVFAHRTEASVHPPSATATACHCFWAVPDQLLDTHRDRQSPWFRCRAESNQDRASPGHDK